MASKGLKTYSRSLDFGTGSFTGELAAWSAIVDGSRTEVVEDLLKEEEKSWVTKNPERVEAFLGSR
jgi:predicted Fe-S protein YdhL (DUF1289 family)